MKRFCLLLLGYFLAITVFAKNNYDFHVGDVYYKILNDNEVEVTYKKFLKEDKKVTQIVVPETVTYKKKAFRVVAIGDYAFKYYNKLQSVTLPNSVKKIGKSAFGWCGDLANINMPDSLVEIGEEAFRGPLIAGKHDIFGNKIEQIVLPNMVKFIGKDAFNFCTQLKNLKLPDTLRNIEDRSFQGCWALTQIDIPSTVTSIGKEAFWGCSKLRRVNLPNSVLTIGSEVFSDCVQLDSVEIPHSVKSIGNNAFKGCKGLKYAYIDTDALKEQLNGLDSLRSVIFGPSVTKISAGALKDCKNLRIVYISPSVEKIGSDAIGNADSCTVLSFVRERPSSWNEKFTENENQVIWGAIYISDEGLVFNISPADKEAMELVGSLRENTQITVPEVIDMGESQRRVIGVGPFNSRWVRTDLKITLPSSINYIENNAFNSVDIKEINIPESVRVIGNKAFMSANVNCEVDHKPHRWDKNWASSITNVSWGSSKLTDMEYGLLDDGTVVLTDYNGTEANVIVPNIVEFDGVEYVVSSIGCNAFLNCGITEISLPNTLTWIDNDAFSGCDNLEEIRLPESIQYIGERAFLNCPNLTIFCPQDYSAVENWASSWCGLTPVICNANDEEVQNLRVFRKWEGGNRKYGLLTHTDDVKVLAPAIHDFVFVINGCIAGFILKYQYGGGTKDLPGKVGIVYNLDGEVLDYDFSEVFENTQAGTSAMQDVISFAKVYGFNKLEAQAHYQESQYYLGKKNFDKALSETNLAYQLDSDLTEAKTFASTIAYEKQAEEQRKQRQEWERQQAELRRQQEEQRRQQEAYERQLARQRELERQQAKLKAVADVLGALAQTTYAVGNTIQQIHDLKHGNTRTYAQTRTQTTNRGAVSSNYTMAQSSEELCRYCSGTKSCKYCIAGIDEKPFSGTSMRTIPPLCKHCYGTGVCQNCATRKASSTSLCPECDGDRVCQKCHNYRSSDCYHCNHKGTCPKCNGTGLR